MNPNFGKTELNLSFAKGNKLNIFKKKIKTDNLLFSRLNYTKKIRNILYFLEHRIFK